MTDYSELRRLAERYDIPDDAMGELELLMTKKLKEENESLKHQISAGASRQWDLRSQVRAAKESRLRVVEWSKRLRDEREQLKAEVDSLTREADRQYTTIEAYRKDAERWRFFSVLANDLQAFPHSWGQMTPEKMDFMCDEAMASAAMGKEPLSD